LLLLKRPGGESARHGCRGSRSLIPCSMKRTRSDRRHMER